MKYLVSLYKSNKTEDSKKEKMDGMVKSIVFVGGVNKGIKKFESYVNSNYLVEQDNIESLIGRAVKEVFGVSCKSDEEGQSLYFQAVQDLRNAANSSFNFETEHVGKVISNFMNNSKDILVIHKSTNETRELVAKLEPQLDVSVWRIFFGYKDDLPEQWDFNVNPEDKNFEERISKILKNEEKIGV